MFIDLLNYLSVSTISFDKDECIIFFIGRKISDSKEEKSNENIKHQVCHANRMPSRLLIVILWLCGRVFDHERQKVLEARSELRSKAGGTGDRSHKIRTYNFPQVDR